MSIRQIKVTFKTLTPLWTGDAWGHNTKIRPSSIIGSLRFWFEVICYFVGITDKNYYEKGKLKDDLNEKEFKEKLLKKGADFEGLDKTLAESGISLPARVFGCAGWKGWIRIQKIKIDQDKKDHNYPTGKIQFKELEYTKKYFDNKEKKEKEKKIIPTWYFKKGFYGKFEVIFEIEDNIVKPLFYPLLTFMGKYGFWGGGWNIGYGRLNIESFEAKNNNDWNAITTWGKEEFNFSQCYKNSDEKYHDKQFSDFVDINAFLKDASKAFEFIKFFLNVDSFYCNSERVFKNKIKNIPKRIRIVRLNYQNNDIKGIIKELLKKKAEIRSCLRPNSSISHSDKNLWNTFRHELLGTTAGETEGTKIIPWIYEEDAQLKGGFISIAGILNLR